MTDDHYATLGVEPKADAATIRAAYLALMRLHHPDKNDSPASCERARAVIDAFAVLGNAETRLHYDWDRRRASEAAAAAAVAPRWHEGKAQQLMFAATLVLLLLVLTPVLMMRAPGETQQPLAAPRAPVAEVKADPARQQDRGAVPPPVAPASPPPLAPPEAEPTIDPVSVAALPDEPQRKVVQLPTPPRPIPPVQAPSRERVTERAKGVPANKPNPPASGKCRLVKPGAETAICNSENLAALDGSVVLFFNQSLSYAPATKRGPLLDSRARFLARRDLCQSDPCLKQLHLAHLRELTAIVASRPADPAP